MGKLWASVLRDYARMDSDFEAVSLGLGSPEESRTNNSEMYIAATRDVISPFYRNSWLKILKAYTSLIGSRDDIFEDTLNMFKSSKSGDKEGGVFQHVLLGLIIESISRVASGGSKVVAAGSNTSESSSVIDCLVCLERLLSPKVLPSSLLPKGAFIELMNLFDRVVQIEDVKTQAMVVRIVSTIITGDGLNILDDDLVPSSDVPGYLFFIFNNSCTYFFYSVLANPSL